MISINKRFSIMLVLIVAVLLIPLIAMQFTTAVNWTLADFAAAAFLLLSTAVACEFTLRKVKSKQYRIALCIAVLLIFLLVWLELAVGIFGTPLAGQ